MKSDLVRRETAGVELFLLMLMFLLVLEPLTLPVANAQALTWTPVTSPVRNTLDSVYCASASDCWAVGYDGTIIQWTGSSWKTVTSPTNNTLQSVYCIGAGDCWAVGGVGTIIQFGGSAWTSVTSPTSNTLHSAFCVSASDCWAVGFNGTILHYSPEY